MPPSTGGFSSEVPVEQQPDGAPGLGDRATTAAQWRLASSFVQGGLHFAVGVVLARLVPPEDFGLVALAAVVVGLASLISDLGMGPAIVRQRPLTHEHLRVGFTVSLLIGLTLALLVLAFSPLAGRLLPNAQLPAVLAAESLLFVFAGLGITSRALLRRRLAYNSLFLIDAGSYLLAYGLVAIVLATLGYGVWSLVIGALLQSLLASVLLVRTASTPLRPLLRRAELRDLMSFGMGMSLNQVVNYAARYGDNLVVGRWLGTATLGLYSRAYSLMMLPQTYFTMALSSVLFPAFCEGGDDPRRLARGYLLAVQVSAIIAAPMMVVMIVAAPHLVVALYGPAWVGAVVPMQILCAVGVLRTVYHVSGALIQGSGRVYSELQRQLVYAVLVFVGAAVGTPYGITGVAVGVSAAIVYMYLAMARLSIQITGSSWMAFFGAQIPAACVACVVGLIALLVRVGLEQQGLGSTAILAGITLASGAAALAAIYLLPESARPAELFATVDRASQRWPQLVRAPIRVFLRVSR